MPLCSHNETGDNETASHKSLRRPIISVWLIQQYSKLMHSNYVTRIVHTAFRKNEISEDWRRLDQSSYQLQRTIFKKTIFTCTLWLNLQLIRWDQFELLDNGLSHSILLKAYRASKDCKSILKNVHVEIKNDNVHLICKDSGQAVAFSELVLHLGISVTMSLRAVGEILVLLLLSKTKTHQGLNVVMGKRQTDYSDI